MRRNRQILLLTVGLLTGCSPYVYTDEIKTFSTGIDTIASAHQTGQQAITAQIDQQEEAARVTARARLMLLPGCDSVDPRGNPPKLADCAIVDYGAEASTRPTAVEARLANDDALFAALKSYAAALAAVTNAADDASLTQAEQGLSSAVGGLSGAVAKIAPAAGGVDSFVTPVGNAIGQGISLYLDSRRYAALRDAVAAVDPAIDILSKTVTADLNDIRAHQVERLEKVLHADIAPLRAESAGKLSEADYRSKLATLKADIAAFDQMRASDPKAIASSMAKAHHDLAEALKNGTGQGLAVLTTVTGFATAAGQLKAAVDASAAPAKN